MVFLGFILSFDFLDSYNFVEDQVMFAFIEINTSLNLVGKVKYFPLRK